MQEETFSTLHEAIAFAFKKQQTSLLSLDQICGVLESQCLFIKTKQGGIAPCSTITRRRISSTLSSSELFVRAGPPRACLWALRPNNPLFLSDSQISASIEQMLTTYGPLTLSQMVEKTELGSSNSQLFQIVLTENKEFEIGSDETWWFAKQPRPVCDDFDNICSAIVLAFNYFPNGATVEELYWILCQSTVGCHNKISRRGISRELSRRQNLFEHVSRAKYIIKSDPNEILANKMYECEPESPESDINSNLDCFFSPFNGASLSGSEGFIPNPIFNQRRSLSEQGPFDASSFFGSDSSFSFNLY